VSYLSRVHSGHADLLTFARVLDAPNLRDDYYCSVLAYSPTSSTLVVGLGDLLYGWSEPDGVKLLNRGASDGSYLTSLSFSSAQGGKCILAFARSNHQLGLMSLYDSLLPRFEVTQATPVSALAWKPSQTMRPSRSPFSSGVLVRTEELLVGDEAGHVYYYSVEWPDALEVARDNWPGEMTLLARIAVHTQQICGIAWSPNGELFATGGNDNFCCLFEASHVLQAQEDGEIGQQPRSGRSEAMGPLPAWVQELNDGHLLPDETDDVFSSTLSSTELVRNLKPGSEKHRWEHGAAVKAIAFCPWRDGLLATGGGSNDKCIHFYHTTSGATLATIAVAAQVTSLIWSNARRELAATFGYASPDHPYRVAVFSWPDCRQIVAIPWEGEHRALFAVSYPFGPKSAKIEGPQPANSEWRRRNIGQDGCIVVASSDESVKFHEVWSAEKKAVSSAVGLLGGSDILEDLEGIDKEGDIIR
jgi:meiosis-specific APC/C activator protein AMA1